LGDLTFIRWLKSIIKRPKINNYDLSELLYLSVGWILIAMVFVPLFIQSLWGLVIEFLLGFFLLYTIYWIEKLTYDDWACRKRELRKKEK